MHHEQDIYLLVWSNSCIMILFEFLFYTSEVDYDMHTGQSGAIVRSLDS